MQRTNYMYTTLLQLQPCSTCSLLLICILQAF